MNKNKDRNVLRCATFCGAEVFTSSGNRDCYKCGSTMQHVGKESNFVKFRDKVLK